MGLLAIIVLATFGLFLLLKPKWEERRLMKIHWVRTSLLAPGDWIEYRKKWWQIARVMPSCIYVWRHSENSVRPPSARDRWRHQDTD